LGQHHECAGQKGCGNIQEELLHGRNYTQSAAQEKESRLELHLKIIALNPHRLRSYGFDLGGEIDEG
jgi:hypothetical protein